MNDLSEEIIYGRQALALGEPWIVPESLEFLKSVIQPTWRVFEWGSGGSTVFWSKNCTVSINIEQNPIWIERTGKMMEDFGCIDNWTIKHVERDDTVHPPFKAYADVILDYPNEFFDLISVDGEASIRDRCTQNSIDKLKPGGYLLLDNSNWYVDQTGWQKWEFYEKELHWVGQEKEFEWWTTILRKGE